MLSLLGDQSAAIVTIAGAAVLTAVASTYPRARRRHGHDRRSARARAGGLPRRRPMTVIRLLPRVHPISRPTGSLSASSNRSICSRSRSAARGRARPRPAPRRRRDWCGPARAGSSCSDCEPYRLSSVGCCLRPIMPSATNTAPTTQLKTTFGIVNAITFSDVPSRNTFTTPEGRIPPRRRSRPTGHRAAEDRGEDQHEADGHRQERQKPVGRHPEHDRPFGAEDLRPPAEPGQAEHEHETPDHRRADAVQAAHCGSSPFARRAGPDPGR